MKNMAMHMCATTCVILTKMMKLVLNYKQILIQIIEHNGIEVITFVKVNALLLLEYYWKIVNNYKL